VTWTSAVIPDSDAADKLFLDACREAHLIVDDGPQWLDGRLCVEFSRGRAKRTVVELEDVP
jgi:hypothetical protein